MKKHYKRTYNERKHIIKHNKRLFGKIDSVRGNEKISRRGANINDEIDSRNSDDFSA